MTKHLTSTSWVIFFKVLSVSKICPVQFVKCLTKRGIWKDTCPVNEEKLFPALRFLIGTNLRFPGINAFPWTRQHHSFCFSSHTFYGNDLLDQRTSFAWFCCPFCFINNYLLFQLFKTQILLKWFYLSGKSSLGHYFFVLSITVIDITFRLSSFSSHGSKRPCGIKKSPSFVRWLFKHLLLNFKGFAWIFVLFKSWSSTGKDIVLVKSLLSFTRLSNIWASSTSNDWRWRRGNRGGRLSKIIFVPTTWRKLLFSAVKPA